MSNGIIIYGTSVAIQTTPGTNALIVSGGNTLATFIYGSMSGDNINTTIAISDSAVYYPVTGLSTGAVNGFTYATSVLTAVYAGKYKVDWSISFHIASGAGKNIEGEVMINTTAQDNTSAHRLIGTGTDTGNMGGTGIITLAVDDTVKLSVKNTTDTVDVVVDHANISLVRVGA